MLGFACLPFGLAGAPQVFTKLLKPVLSILRPKRIAYLDDILLMAPSRQLVLQHAASTLNLLEGLGFRVNYLKAEHCRIFPTNGVFRVPGGPPRDKLRKIQSKCELLLDNPVTSVRELSKFLGLLSSYIQAVFPAPLHSRYL